MNQLNKIICYDVLIVVKLLVLGKLVHRQSEQ